MYSLISELYKHGILLLMKLIIFHIFYFFFPQQLLGIINFFKDLDTTAISFVQQKIDISIFVSYTKNTKKHAFSIQDCYLKQATYWMMLNIKTHT